MCRYWKDEPRNVALWLYVTVHTSTRLYDSKMKENRCSWGLIQPRSSSSSWKFWPCNTKMRFWTSQLLEMKGLWVDWTWTREKRSLSSCARFSEDFPITRWCPTTGTLKPLLCLCNFVFWKSEVVSFSLLSPGAVTCAASWCKSTTMKLKGIF